MSKLITIESSNRPSNATNGDLFYETDTGRLLLYYEGFRAYGTANTSQPEKTDLAVSIIADVDNVEQTVSDNRGADIIINDAINSIVASVNGNLIDFTPDGRRSTGSRSYRQTLDDLIVELDPEISADGTIITASNAGVSLSEVEEILVTYQRDSGAQTTHVFSKIPHDEQPLTEYTSLPIRIEETPDDLYNSSTHHGLVINMQAQHDDITYNMPFGLMDGDNQIVGNMEAEYDNHVWCYRLSSEEVDDYNVVYIPGDVIDTSSEDWSWTVSFKILLNEMSADKDNTSRYRQLFSYSNQKDAGWRKHGATFIGMVAGLTEDVRIESDQFDDTVLPVFSQYSAKPAGTASAVTIRSDQNIAVSLTFDGQTTINQAIDAYNANGSNTATLTLMSGDGDQTPNDTVTITFTQQTINNLIDDYNDDESNTATITRASGDGNQIPTANMLLNDGGEYYLVATHSNYGQYDGMVQYKLDGDTKHHFKNNTWYCVTVKADRDSYIADNATGNCTIKWFVNDVELHSVSSAPGSNFGNNRHSFRDWFGSINYRNYGANVDLAQIVAWEQRALPDDVILTWHAGNQVLNKQAQTYLPQSNMNHILCADWDTLFRTSQSDDTLASAFWVSQSTSSRWNIWKSYNSEYYTKQELYHKIQY